MKNKIFFIIFISVWIVIIGINFLFPKQTFSQEENRMLAVIPRFTFESFINGDYLNGVNDYINDHFAFRNIYLKLNSFWETSIMRKKENNGVYIGKNGYLFEKFEFGEEQKENENKNIIAISNFTKKMNEINIPTYFILVPNSIYINSDKLPDNVEVANQQEIINYVYENLKNTNNINITTALDKQNDITPVYFKTDHHINSDGAYVIYNEFCKHANIKSVPLNEFTRITLSNNFLGTFDSKAQIINQSGDELFAYQNETNTNVKEVVYDKERTNSINNSNYLNKKDKYSYFLNGNNSKVIIRTNVNNNNKLLIIKDSYAHIMAQFLCQNYSELHFLDPRYTNFNYEKYIVENKITDVLFLFNVSTFTKDNNLTNLIRYN